MKYAELKQLHQEELAKAQGALLLAREWLGDYSDYSQGKGYVHTVVDEHLRQVLQIIDGLRFAENDMLGFPELSQERPN